MSGKSKREYLEKIRWRYAHSGKRAKSKILDEFCAVCGYSRKHAIKLLRGRVGRRKRRPGPKRRYGAEVLEPLKRIWLATDQLCSKRLKAALALWLPHYEKIHGILKPRVRRKLLAISCSTIDRLLAPVRVKYRGKGLSGTKPGSLLKNQIAIRTDNWDIQRPGFLEADSVAHCGDSLAGNFVWSVVFTDICTGWTHTRAVWNKGAEGVKKQTADVEQKLPFELLGFDCDNGGEFLNYHLLSDLQARNKPVQFTRSRPYHKNDNAHVEQKNWTHVRQFLGYDRFENPAIVDLLNNLYSQEWDAYQNFFRPSVKLIEKKRIGSKYRKRYDEPRTPYQRVLAAAEVTADQRVRLKTQFDQLNPFELKKAIERKLKSVFAAAKVRPS
jgi:hypothetical protein